MVIGIIAALVSLVPLIGYLTFIPSILGLILGIIDIAAKVKLNKAKSEAVAGVVLNAFAIFCVAAWTIVIALFVSRSGENIKQFSLLIHEQIAKYNVQQAVYKSESELDSEE